MQCIIMENTLIKLTLHNETKMSVPLSQYSSFILKELSQYSSYYILHTAIWRLSLLTRIIASFLRYTGYLNFINYPMSRARLLLILVHVLSKILNKLKSKCFLASSLSTLISQLSILSCLII